MKNYFSVVHLSISETRISFINVISDCIFYRTFFCVKQAMVPKKKAGGAAQKEKTVAG